MSAGRPEQKAEDLREAMFVIGRAARAASRELALASTATKNAALCAMAAHLRQQSAAILKANAADLEAAKAGGLAASFIDRLTLTEARIEAMARGLEDIAEVPDPVGATLAEWTRPNGLQFDARACAHRRDRDHLREPAERDGGCRWAVHQGWQRGYSADGFGCIPVFACDPRVSGGGLAGSRLTGPRDPAHSDNQPVCRRSFAVGARRDGRRDRAARRAFARRAGAVGRACAGVRASGRHLPYLRRQSCRPGHGEADRRQCEDAANGDLRGDGVSARRQGRTEVSHERTRHGASGFGLRSSWRRGGAAQLMRG